MLLVDTLGLTPFLSFILALSLTFGVFWCLQLLEEHPLIDLPGQNSWSSLMVFIAFFNVEPSAMSW